MSEQECAYSLLELPITQSSIEVEFINTSEIHNRVFIAKPDYMLQKRDPDSEEIKQQNNVDKYAQRPHVLKQMCLADFIALTDTVYSNNPIVSDDEMSGNENSSDEENEDITKQSSHTHNLNQLLGGLSLHLNHLIASRMANYNWPFGTLPFGLFWSNLGTRDLETYPRIYSGHFLNMSIFDDSRAV